LAAPGPVLTYGVWDADGAPRGEIVDDAAMIGPSDSESAEPAEPRRKLRVGERVRRADSQPRLVATARFIRRLLPGDDRYGDALSTAGERMPQRIGRLVSEAQPERPSAARELGLAALQAWQALSEAQGRGRGTVDVAILFTDIVEFSSWALDVGDEPALELLRRVATIEDDAIAAHRGSLVKRLGDGSMSVFREAEDAVGAALEAQGGVQEVEVHGHSAELRSGVHLGRPRRVGSDYLGVDVNIAARVGERADGGEVLVSEPVRRALDAESFRFGHERLLRGTGAPRDLAVCSVTPR
jgi:adenylate cyclase